jgi:hypothetical protein
MDEWRSAAGDPELAPAAAAAGLLAMPALAAGDINWVRVSPRLLGGRLRIAERTSKALWMLNVYKKPKEGRKELRAQKMNVDKSDTIPHRVLTSITHASKHTI